MKIYPGYPSMKIYPGYPSMKIYLGYEKTWRPANIFQIACDARTDIILQVIILALLRFLH